MAGMFCRTRESSVDAPETAASSPKNGGPYSRVWSTASGRFTGCGRVVLGRAAPAGVVVGPAGTLGGICEQVPQ